MLPVILAVVLAAGGSGGVGVPAQGQPHVLLPSSRDTAVLNRTVASFVATFSGEAFSLNWTQSISGIDGIGAGNDVFRVAILSGPPGGPLVDVCHIDVACDAASSADYTVTCSGAAFTAGQDIDVRTTSMPCLGAPTGFQTTDLLMTW